MTDHLTDATIASTATAGNLSDELSAALGGTLPGILSQVARRFNIDQISADSGGVGDLDIEKVVLGEATIENIILTNTQATLNGASAFLQNVRSVLELRFTLDWEVDLGWLGSWDGRENLGSLSFGMNLGNVSVPSLANIDMHIPTMSIPNATLNMQPINNLDLGGAQFRALLAENTNAPANGFNLTGMGIGKVSVEDVSLPKTTTQKVTLQEFSPNSAVVLPGAQVQNLQIPAARVDNITSGGFNLSALASPRCLEVDLGILELKICVEPVIHMEVGSMLIENAEISAAAQKLQVENIAIPVTVRGIAMRDMTLNAIKVNKITL